MNTEPDAEVRESALQAALTSIRRRLTPATAFALCSLALLVTFAQRGGGLIAWYRDPFHGTVIPEPPPSGDIKRWIGSSVQLPSSDSDGRHVVVAHGAILAPAPCGSCTNPRTWLKALEHSTTLPIFVLMSAPDKPLESDIKRRRPDAIIVHANGQDKSLSDISTYSGYFFVVTPTRVIASAGSSIADALKLNRENRL